MNAQDKQSLRTTLSRRAFFQISALTGVGLAISIYVPGRQLALAAASTPTPTPTPTQVGTPPGQLAPNIYVTLDKTSAVTVKAFRVEMGQGIRTALAMMVAEELDVDWDAIRIEQVGADSAYGDQITGGSESVAGSYSILRKAGATARQLLVTAAAQQWNVPATQCRTEAGWVIHTGSKRRLAYGALVEAAAKLPIPKAADVTLKDPKQFRIIGAPRTLYDAPQMVKGSAIFTSDVRLPNLLYAAVARCPVFGGKVTRYDATKAKAVPGVRAVIEIDSGIAVVAEHTWAALQGRDALTVTWDEGQYAKWTSASIREIALKLAPQLGKATASEGETVLEAAYDIPYFAHATMEPKNCVADVRADRCEVWAPTQDPQQAKQRAQSITGLAAAAVTIHVPLLGGGFGRGQKMDYVEDAVQISKTVGAPVQLVWTRTDDLQHDFYHPLNHVYISARLDADGWPKTLPYPRPFPIELGVPTGPWRAVENVPAAFARESFLDEIAAASKLDPYQLRMKLLPEAGRRVVELAATKAGWGKALPAGSGRGLAYHATWDVTHVAQVAEVMVTKDGVVRVQRVVCAVDCGTVINPDSVVAQMEGGTAFGLTAALKASITIDQGRVQQGNFDDYPLLTIDEMPEVEVHLVPGDNRPPTGIGEMGVPPIAPAVANAIYAATGIRVRHLPILPADLREG